MPARAPFPISPKTTAQLEIGDVIAIPLSGGRWGALQITDLLRSGPASRSSFVAGPLPWDGTEHPTANDVAGLAVTEQALIHTDLFRHGGFQVTANTTPASTGLPSSFRDHGVGTRTKVWGWRTAIQRVADAADSRA